MYYEIDFMKNEIDFRKNEIDFGAKPPTIACKTRSHQDDYPITQETV
jgi:hypothetical protein